MKTRRAGLRHDEAPSAGASRVRVEMFPLLATLDRLQQICDRQFNDHIPRSVAIFRPAFPFVICGVLHYPDMGDFLPWQTGTLSQNECYFLVPLERYREVDGKEELVELGVTTPYIFVDNPESVAAARERFGMPKELAQLSTNFSELPWEIGPQNYLRVQCWEPSKSGHRLGELLDISYATTTPFQLGARDDDPSLPRFDPLEGLKLLDQMRQLLERQLGPAGAAEVIPRIQAYVTSLLRSQEMNLFSLRQFPNPEDPVHSTYQDLIAFRMKVIDTQALGLLGQGPLRTQYQLRLRHSELRPISKLLGLRVIQRTSRDVDGEVDSFDQINPLLPFYAQSDIDLISADRICWRYSDGKPTRWHTEDGKAHGPERLPAYVTGLAPSDAPFLQPDRDLPIVDVKLLLLPARREVVEALLAEMIPAESAAFVRVRLLSHGPHTAVRVLLSKSRPRPADEQDELIWMDGELMTISVPVEVEIANGKTLRAHFFLQDFSSNPFMVLSTRAMLGEPTTEGIFEPVEGGWFASSRPVSQLLGVSAMALERSSSGATVDWHRLIEIFGLAEETPTADLVELRKALWPHTSQVLPGLSVGHVPWAHRADRNIFDRVMLSFYPDVETFQLSSSSGARVVRFRDNDTFPICKQAGLVALGAEAPIHALIPPAGAASQLVPVIAHAEGTSRVRFDHFEILSETSPHYRDSEP